MHARDAHAEARFHALFIRLRQHMSYIANDAIHACRRDFIEMMLSRRASELRRRHTYDVARGDSSIRNAFRGITSMPRPLAAFEHSSIAHII